MRLEVDGDVFTLENNQEKARVDRDRAARRRQLLQIRPVGQKSLELATWTHNDATDSMTEEMDETMRAIGWIMVQNKQRELWRLAYLRFAEAAPTRWATRPVFCSTVRAVAAAAS